MLTDNIRSCFCKLVMSLYIDHEPLNKRTSPNFCRLFSHIDILEDVKIFK